MKTLLARAVDDIAARVPGQEMQDDDFVGEDGLLYCGKCKTRKQTRINLLGEEKIVPIMCACQKKEYEDEEEQRKNDEFNKTVARLRRECFPTMEVERYTFAIDDQHDKRISSAMRRYVDKWEDIKAENLGLLLYGPVGTGKSFYAACIANALISKGVPVIMTSFARIVNTMQGAFGGRQDYIDKLVSYPLLIIDDLGAERGSDYMLEQVYAVVDARYQAGLPLIVTTNIPIDEIKEPADLKYKRIYDRILERCHPVEIKGPSRRRESLKANYIKHKNLLGL